MKHSQAYKSGFCDAIMGRDATAPQSWQHAPKYMQGYLAGRESGVIFKTPAPEYKQNITEALQRGAFSQGLSASIGEGGFVG